MKTSSAINYTTMLANTNQSHTWWVAFMFWKKKCIYGSQKKIGSGTRSPWQIGPLRYTGNTQRFCLFRKLNCKAEAHEMFTLIHPPPSKPTISQIHSQKERESFKVYSGPHIHFQNHYSSWISQVRDNGGGGSKARACPPASGASRFWQQSPEATFSMGIMNILYWRNGFGWQDLASLGVK